MTPPPAPDLITTSMVVLAAARSAEDLEIRSFYAAMARNSIDALDEQLRRLRLNLTTLEAELVRRGRPEEKRMVGASGG
jgi:hypothetical protein